MKKNYINALAASVLIILVSGCDYTLTSGELNTDDKKVQIKTSAKVSDNVKVSMYQVEAVFKTKGKTQLDATRKLTDTVSGFEQWVKAKQYTMQSNAANLNEIHHYPIKDKRELAGYEATVHFQFPHLSFDEYQDVMSGVPTYKPSQLHLLNAMASDDDINATEEKLISQAYLLIKKKADAMAKAANLCHMRVSYMSERSYGNGVPRAMRMEMASDSVHKTESKQNMTVDLSVNWLAEACSKI